jgi:very-short-patch-repair endonuclease
MVEGANDEGHFARSGTAGTPSVAASWRHLPRFAGEDDLRAPELTFRRARALRRAMTPPEVRLWVRLRARGEGLPIFRRQHPMGSYILDFYCAAAKLAVEIDGEGHGMGDRPERDRHRDAWLAERGVTTLRVPAVDVMRRFEDTVQMIFEAANTRIAGTD